MRFGSILLLLLLVVGIVFAFNTCGPGKDAVNKAVDATKGAASGALEAGKNVAGNAANAVKSGAEQAMDAVKGVSAEVMEAGKKPLDSVDDLAKRVPEFTSAKQDGDSVYIHAHEADASVGVAPAAHVLNSVASQLPGILATEAQAATKHLVVYQTLPAKDANGADIEQNIFTYTFDMEAIRQADLKEPITMWDLLPFLVEPTGPKVGKDMSMPGMQVRDAICGMASASESEKQALAASALCAD